MACDQYSRAEPCHGVVVDPAGSSHRLVRRHRLVSPHRELCLVRGERSKRERKLSLRFQDSLGSTTPISEGGDIMATDLTGWSHICASGLKHCPQCAAEALAKASR